MVGDGTGRRSFKLDVHFTITGHLGAFLPAAGFWAHQLLAPAARHSRWHWHWQIILEGSEVMDCPATGIGIGSHADAAAMLCVPTPERLALGGS
jgi:hypothetical protein